MGSCVPNAHPADDNEIVLLYLEALNRDGNSPAGDLMIKTFPRLADGRALQTERLPSVKNLTMGGVAFRNQQLVLSSLSRQHRNKCPIGQSLPSEALS